MTDRDYDSVQVTDEARVYPIDRHGKLRFARFSFTASGAVAADSTIGLCWLPEGRKLILPSKSVISHSAYGAARTLDIGHTAYMNRNAAVAALEAEDPDAFTPAGPLDVSGAGASVAWDTLAMFEMFSQDRVLIFATIAGGTIPDAGTLSGYVAYVYE